jgi:very-short-patch-repair endonuclease
MTLKQRKINMKSRALSKYLRRNQTYAEKLLWSILRNRQLLETKWRRQYPIGNYVIDFHCAQCQLIIELDGDYHVYRKKSDNQRSAWLVEKGYHVVRFTNRDVIHNISGVIDRIIECIETGSVIQDDEDF